MSGHFDDTCFGLTCMEGEVIDSRTRVYIDALKHHNWNYEFSDSQATWQLGRSNDLRSFSGTNRIADSIVEQRTDSDG